MPACLCMLAECGGTTSQSGIWGTELSVTSKCWKFLIFIKRTGHFLKC